MSIIEKAVDKMMGKLEQAAPADAPDTREDAVLGAADTPSARSEEVAGEQAGEAGVARGAAPYRPTETPAEVLGPNAHGAVTPAGAEAPEFIAEHCDPLTAWTVLIMRDGASQPWLYAKNVEELTGNLENSTACWLIGAQHGGLIRVLNGGDSLHAP